MVTYCLEFGEPEDRYVIIHKLSCTNIDHGSLLGMGRLTALGNFASSFSALSSAKRHHEAAAPCLNCGMANPAPVSAAHRNFLILVQEDFDERARDMGVEPRQFQY